MRQMVATLTMPRRTDTPLFPDARPPELPARYRHPGEWLQELRLDQDKSQPQVEALSAQVGERVVASYLSRIEKGERGVWQVGPRKLETLRVLYGIDRNVFEAYTGRRIPTGARIPPDSFSDSSGGAASTRTGPQPGDRVSALVSVAKPIRALATAGSPVVASEDHLGVVHIPAHEDRAGLELFLAEGDSMTTLDPDSLRHGDTLFVDTHDLDRREGEVYVIRIHGDGTTVKRLQRIGGEWWLVSDNGRKHPPFRADEADLLGRVLYWTRTMRPERP